MTYEIFIAEAAQKIMAVALNNETPANNEELKKLAQSSIHAAKLLAESLKEDFDQMKAAVREEMVKDYPKWRPLPLIDGNYPTASWCVMNVATSTVGSIRTLVLSLVNGNYYIPLFELEKLPIKKEAGDGQE